MRDMELHAEMMEKETREAEAALKKSMKKNEDQQLRREPRNPPQLIGYSWSDRCRLSSLSRSRIAGRETRSPRWRVRREWGESGKKVSREWGESG